MAGGGTTPDNSNPNAPPQAGGLLGQAQAAIEARKRMLDDPTKAPAAPPPVGGLLAPPVKGIRPGFEQLDPSQWTEEERAAFRKAHNIEKPSIFQQLFGSSKK